MFCLFYVKSGLQQSVEIVKANHCHFCLAIPVVSGEEGGQYINYVQPELGPFVSVRE